jgi:hypothetical protein
LNTQDCPVEYVKWEAETVDKEIQEADFALLPEKLNMRFQYKSPNKTTPIPPPPSPTKTQRNHTKRTSLSSLHLPI